MNSLKYKCVIIDDEPAAHYVLANHIEKSPALVLTGQCYNAVEALHYLREHEADIIFLDIDMPEISGMELLQLLKNPPKTILTTAHTHYALESYEYGVIDYLLKPVSSSRFLKAVDKVLSATGYTKMAEPEWLTVKIDGSMHNIPITYIDYIQSYGNYVKIFTPERTFLAAMTTQEVMTLIPASQFIRIHKSYIAAIQKITAWTPNSVILSGKELPVGITYKRFLQDRLKEL